jgi:Ca-activated chloride channel homolog
MNCARVVQLLALLTLMAPAAARAQGMLLPTDASLGPLQIKYQRVSVEIADGTSVTKVEQVFSNSSGRQLEAHFVFPLPKGAALQDFYLWMNGKKTKGEVLEKEKATQIYEGIVRRLQDPGLLEYVDTDAFRARVFPVPANGEMKIELAFSQVLGFQGGLYHYSYPLGAGTKGAPALRVTQDFTFSAKVKSKVPLRSIYSPTHRLGVSRKAEGEAVVGLELGAGTDISKDLDLYYTVSDKAVGLSLLTHRPDPSEPGYFVALISPRADVPKEEQQARRITFVVDTSGSMMGERIKMARDTLKYCVQRLEARDEFNIVRFSTDVEALFEKPMLANPDAVAKAVRFVESFDATGGTAIDEALVRGLADGKNRGDRTHLVMFITDGHPTVGDTDENVISNHSKGANVGGSRVFTFGLGEDLNARLLDRLAEQGGGVADFMRDGKEFEVKVSGFMDKVSSPVLTDLALDMSKFEVFDVYPKKLPDLFKGTQLVVMGRYRNPADAQVVLTGTLNGKKKVFEYNGSAVKQSADQAFIPRLWAIRKVGYLLEEIRLRGLKQELKDEVIALGKKFGIVTPYTSYLVVEDQPMPVAANRPPPPPMQRPWEDDRLARKEERPSRFAPQKAPAPEPSAPASAAGAPKGKVASDEFDSSFEGAFGGSGVGGLGTRGRGGSAAEAEKKMDSSGGKDAIAVSKATRTMKEQERGPGAAESTRVAAGKTFVWNSGGWIESEAIGNLGKQLKVKYLSDGYFALLKARPDLKAALALGDRVVVIVAKGKTVVIGPDGETAVDKVTAFLK